MELPYREIPKYPENYLPGNILARLIDGLGFRFYWATEGLTKDDLTYRPSENGRSIFETMEHINVLSNNILLAPDAKPYEKPVHPIPYSFGDLRKKVLLNLQSASNKVQNATMEDMENYKVIFNKGERKFEFPIWNIINGMISDCIHHTGQIVLMRRANGNPQNPKVNVFMGKTGG